MNKIQVHKLLYTLSLVLCFYSSSIHGQSIQREELGRLTENQNIKAHVVELNNDEYHDLILLQNIKEDSSVAYIYLQVAPLQFEVVDTIDNLTSNQIYLTDINNSGQMDLLVYAKLTGAPQLQALMDYEIENGFQKATLFSSDSISDLQVADMNNDGRKDILYRKGDQFTINYQSDTLKFPDSFSFPNVTKYLISSIDDDGYLDLILLDEQGKKMNMLSRKGMDKWDTLSIDINYTIDQWRNADINHDGLLDIVVVAKSGDSSELYALTRNSISYDKKHLYSSDTIQSFHVGDFSNDGLYDISLTASEQSFLLTLDSLGEQKSVAPIDSTLSIRISGIGDIDNDGDLDWVGSHKNADSISVFLYVNQPEEKNEGPKYINISAPVTVGDQTKFNWYTSNDDRTPSASISYDFYIEYVNENDSSYVISPDYDLVNSPRIGSRNMSRHGYNLLDTVYRVFDLPQGKYFWGVAGVDNAYYSSTDIRNCNGLGECKNDSFVSQCLEIYREDTLLCVNDTLSLSFGAETDSVVWTSQKRGILGYGNMLITSIKEEDEISAVAIPKRPCDDPKSACTKNYTISISLRPGRDLITEPITLCEDSILFYQIKPEEKISEIVWYTDTNMLAQSDSLWLSPDMTDSLVYVKIDFEEYTCPIYDTLLINRPGPLNLNVLPDITEVCFNQTIEIEVGIPDSIAGQIDYTIQANNLVLDTENPGIRITDSTTVIFEGTYLSCQTVLDTLTILPSHPPTIQVEGQHQIYLGESTQLIATGADHFEWSPATDLSSPFSGTTNASPKENTTYEIKGWNVEGCEGKTTFVLEVTPTVFIPELFTPNGDGSNDRLIVHGNQIENLNFAIYDGNGKVVYETRSVSEITMNGWNGTQNGNAISPGTYIWKIEGKFKNGDPVTFKGKNSGELKVVR